MCLTRSVTRSNGDFVDFHHLLTKDEAAYTLQFKDLDGTPQHVLGPAGQRKPLSWEQWASAWNIFQMIFLQAHPKAIPHLAKHYENVQGLYSTGRCWRFYDTTFRRLIEKGLASWGQNHSEIKDEVRGRQELGAVGNASHSSRQGVEHNFPMGVCKKYQSSGVCRFKNECKFQHNC